MDSKYEGKDWVRIPKTKAETTETSQHQVNIKSTSSQLVSSASDVEVPKGLPAGPGVPPKKHCGPSK